MFIAMHIPDGFLSLPVSLAGWGLLIVGLGVALRQTQFGERQYPLLGILAAFVFAAQMINFPVAGGTSGHLLGGALVAILMGPWAALLVMTCVLAVQALLFQDGGVLALGFNSFNMGVIAAFVGYAVYQWLKQLGGNDKVAAFGAAWVSVEVAAAATALELAISRTASLGVVLPAMVGVHALIGIGEGLITVGALAFIQQTRPDLISNPQGNRWVAAGLIIALVITLFSPLASPHPDGLERVAADKAFLETAENPPYEILPDYTVPFIENEALTTILAGVIGVMVVVGVGFAAGKLNKKHEPV